jgi:hypothetical protein
MHKIPTDLKILYCIYGMYAEHFRRFDQDDTIRSARIYVPIDLVAIAASLKTDRHELFGRLRYDLDHRYRYKQEDGSLVHLFAQRVGSDIHCINYPYLTGILSQEAQKDRQSKWALWISCLSLIVALAALVAQISAT